MQISLQLQFVRNDGTTSLLLCRYLHMDTPPTVLQTCFLACTTKTYLTLPCLHHSIVVSLRRSCYNLRVAYYYPATSRSDLTTYDHDVDFFSENQHQRGLGSPASEVQQQWRATILRKEMTKICVSVMRCYG